MKLTGPLLIILLLLCLPAQAQVERNSRNLTSRQHAGGNNLPTGWLSPTPEPDGFKWGYRQELAVRRLFSSIQLDAQAIMRSSLQQQSLALLKPALDSTTADKPKARFKQPAEESTKEAGSDPAAEMTAEPAAEISAEPAAEISVEPEALPAFDFPEAVDNDSDPASDEAVDETAAGPAPDANEAATQPEAELPAELDSASDPAPEYDFRIKDRPARDEAAAANDTSRESGRPATGQLFPEEEQPAADAETATEAATDAPADTADMIDEALARLAHSKTPDRADTGFIPDEDSGFTPDETAAMPEPEEAPIRGAAPERSIEPAAARLVPTAGKLAELGSRPAPLQPQLLPERPLLPEYEIRSDISKITRGNGKLHQVALTFDDGPHPQYTSQILAILDYYNAPATFFFVGVQASKYPEWLLMAHQQGHEIGSQTYDHFRLPKLPESEKEYQIDAYQDLVEQLIGERPRFLRPPGGQIDDKSIELLKQRGMVCAMWDVALNDTHGNKTREELLQHTLDSVRNGSVILAHDGVQATIDMLPELIERLREDGYELVTMSELASGL